ncbi:MAG: rhodanese-related sulfurtransferase [Myxococcota bacterium]|nr:rhodanese-related sulfurtransferase [Myxococcota bacterium]
MNSTRFHVIALYKFVELEDFYALKAPILSLSEQAGLMGTLILAREGINGTVAGPKVGVEALLALLRSDHRLADLEHKESYAEGKNPFHRMKVHLKPEIVTMGIPDIDPTRCVGQYVAPEDWNDLIKQDDVVVIDTRNTYETAIGTFDGAHDPQTTNFRDFPNWVRENRTLLGSKSKIAMFCTGGIRCEKATSLLLEEGYDEVYHLKGGILKYLEQVPEQKSLWQGECFVFDQRVSVGHELVPGQYDLCHACRHPIDEAAKASPLYEVGVSCPHCHDQTTSEQKARFSERQKQIRLAAARGEQHFRVNSGFERKRTGRHDADE